MEAVYRTAGITKQAVHQHVSTEDAWSEKLNELQVQVDEIRSIHSGCGLEKLYDTLQPSWLGRDRFIKAFMELGYRVRKPANFTRTTTPTALKYPNLIKGLLVWDENRVWQTDITYFEVCGRFYYIVFIIDIYTKVLKGYHVSNNMRAEANIAALKMALKDAACVKGLIHHSDRGSQFVDNDYRDILSTHGIHMSMGLTAEENAYAERINGIIKNEYLKGKKINTLNDLCREVRIAVNHYNFERIHRHLPGKKTPKQFQSELVHLSTQNRPKVIVYTEGNPKITAASSRPDFNPETEPQVHVCPMVID